MSTLRQGFLQIRTSGKLTLLYLRRVLTSRHVISELIQAKSHTLVITQDAISDFLDLTNLHVMQEYISKQRER